MTSVSSSPPRSENTASAATESNAARPRIVRPVNAIPPSSTRTTFARRPSRTTISDPATAPNPNDATTMPNTPSDSLRSRVTRTAIATMSGATMAE